MRKKSLFGLLSVLGMAAVLVSCTQDEIEQKSAQRQTAAQNTIGISVVDGLFSGESSTRAIVGGLDDHESFDEYRTTFEAGDAIGVFDVDKDGKIVRSNVKYVCNGTRWNIDDDATKPVEFDDEHSYYAYYPYMPDLKSTDPDKEGNDKTVELDPDGKIAENSTVTAGEEAGEFFKDVTANWVVLDNQGGETLIDKAGYVLSDLMVAKGVRTEGADKYTIEFKMKHQMGLVMLNFGVMERVVDSQIKWNEPVTQTFKGTTRPYVVQGKARYIVNPASPTPKLITASDGTWKQTVFVKERGHYQEYRIEGSKGYTLQIGDIVWSDGSFTKSVEYDKFYDKRPIGIIGYLGNDNVVDGKTDENGKRRYSHGIIVATWGIQSVYANTDSYDLQAASPENFSNCNRYSLCHYDYCGLEKTRWMQEQNTSDNIKFIVNDLLMAVKPLDNVFLPINKHGHQSRQSAQEIEEQYQSDRQMITFPAGLCSRKLKGGNIGDLEWKKFVVTHAVSSQRDIIPVYFDGQNSKKFYRMARWRERLGIKLNIEMVLLPGEMFKSSGSTYKVHFGKPVKWQSLNSRNARAEAARLRDMVYELKES